MYEWDCPYCEFTQQNAISDSLKDTAKNHLKWNHLDDVEDEFRGGYKGDCRSSCGYTFPYDEDEHPGLECPNCSEDHTNWYTGMLVNLDTVNA
jgi:RNA polymerase subunit RPABC4/transcription elongation factor Spt4